MTDYTDANYLNVMYRKETENFLTQFHGKEHKITIRGDFGCEVYFYRSNFITRNELSTDWTTAVGQILEFCNKIDKYLDRMIVETNNEKSLADKLDEIAENGFCGSSTLDGFIKLCNELIENGYTEDEAIDFLRSVYDLVASEFGR